MSGGVGEETVRTTYQMEYDAEGSDGESRCDERRQVDDRR